MFEAKFFSLTKRKRKKYDIIFIVTLLKFRKKGKKRMKRALSYRADKKNKEQDDVILVKRKKNR